MKHVQLAVILMLALVLVACGGSGSGSSHNNGGSGGPGAGPGVAPIDPSGNWDMVVSDGSNQAHFAALFNQVGAVVTANSFTAAGNVAPFNCVPFSATLANGNVTGNNFTGNVTVHYAVNFPSDLTPTQSTFSFNTTVAADEKSISGSYASLPACTGVGASGTFTGTAIPSTTASWTGTITPCSYDSQTGVCTDNGAATGMTATLTEDDATGNVSGAYSVSQGLAGWQGGTIAVALADQDILSGFVWQFTLTDASNTKYVAHGLLDLNGGFSGVVAGGGNHFNLHMAH